MNNKLVYEQQTGRVQDFHYPIINQFADQFQQRFSQFQSNAAIIDLVNRPLAVDPQEAWTQQVATVEDVSDISSCRCAIYLRKNKRQDISTS